MGFLQIILRWGWTKNSKATSAKEFRLLYGWANPAVPPYQQCPYVYLWKITPTASLAITKGIQKGAKMRETVLEELIFEGPLDRLDCGYKNPLGAWNEIIPTGRRTPTHRIELGILRKKSGIPRSAFFSEYFCFTPIGTAKTSDQIAIQVAGFLASQLKEVKVFDGVAIGGHKSYWLMCVYAAWKQFGR
jgi:hypothetical protein